MLVVSPLWTPYHCVHTSVMTAVSGLLRSNRSQLASNILLFGFSGRNSPVLISGCLDEKTIGICPRFMLFSHCLSLLDGCRSLERMEYMCLADRHWLYEDIRSWLYGDRKPIRSQ